MAQKPLGVSSIIVDDPNITISRASDGSLLLSDNFVPGLKLKDIIAGSVIIEPAVLIVVEASDWVVDPVTTLYALDVPTNFALTGTELALISVIIKDLNFKTIAISDVQVQPNNVYLLSTNALNMYVAIKRL